MAEYTCTLTYNGEQVTAEYLTRSSTGIFSVGDTINFVSVNNDAVIRFADGSPFEKDAKPKSYPIPLGTPVALTLQRTCFANTALAPGAEPVISSLPTEKTQGTGKTYECRLSILKNAIVPVWYPNKPLFYLGDKVRFTSEAQATITLDFPLGSPFEAAPGAMTYQVSNGQPLEVEFRRSCFVFLCSIPGVPPAGSGHSVPTGKGS